MENKEKEERLSKVKEALEKLEEAQVEGLSDEDLDSVAGGLCSIWCCSKAA